MDSVSEFLGSKIDAGDFPSAVYLVAEKGEIVFEDALGLAVVEPEKIEANIETIYDLASLTKVLVTGLMLSVLIEKYEVGFEDKLADFFAEFDRYEKRDITIENLVTHTSGFQAWSPFYADFAKSKKMQRDKFVFEKIWQTELEYKTNSKVVYSDFNFIMLGFLIEKLFDMSLDEVARTYIFEPLELEHTFFNPPMDKQKQIAASENGNAYEKQIAKEVSIDARIDESMFRSETIWGEVHDNNCHFLNGVAGHAGVFSNVRETFKIAQQFLAESTILLEPEICNLFRTNFTPQLNQARSLAFQLAETEDSTASEALSKDSFGHLGFTGTSLWIDPTKERIYLLLTNRTHNRSLPLADLKETRQLFHRRATKILDKN